MAEMACPSCGHTLTGHIGVNSPTPTPGAISVCVYCRALSIFTPFGTLRRPTDAEETEILADEDVIRAIHVVGEYHRHHGTPT